MVEDGRESESVVDGGGGEPAAGAESCWREEQEGDRMRSEEEGNVERVGHVEGEDMKDAGAAWATGGSKASNAVVECAWDWGEPSQEVRTPEDREDIAVGGDIVHRFGPTGGESWQKQGWSWGHE